MRNKISLQEIINKKREVKQKSLKEVKEELKKLKKTHKEIKISGLNKSELLVMLSKYLKLSPPEKAVKGVEKKKEGQERVAKVIKERKRKVKVENLEHNLGVIDKLNKIRKFSKVVKEKLDTSKRVKKILEEVESEVKVKHSRQKRLNMLQSAILQYLSAKRVVKFLEKVEGKIVSKREYKNMVFV